MTIPSFQTIVMIIALACVTSAATGCFWLSRSKKKNSQPPEQESCEGLDGKLKEECEARRKGR